MSEKQSPMKLVKIEYICDDCKKQPMRREDDVVLMSNPPKYWHVCDCGCRVMLTKSYPHVTAVEA